MEAIKINGYDYPLGFTLYWQSEFEHDSGIALEEFDNLPKHQSTRALIKLLYWSLRDGARVAKKPLRLSYEELIDAIEAETVIIENFSKVLQARYEKKVEAGQKQS